MQQRAYFCNKGYTTEAEGALLQQVYCCNRGCFAATEGVLLQYRVYCCNRVFQMNKALLLLWEQLKFFYVQDQLSGKNPIFIVKK